MASDTATTTAGLGEFNTLCPSYNARGRTAHGRNDRCWIQAGMEHVRYIVGGKTTKQYLVVVMIDTNFVRKFLRMVYTLFSQNVSYISRQSGGKYKDGL